MAAISRTQEQDGGRDRLRARALRQRLAQGEVTLADLRADDNEVLREASELGHAEVVKALFAAGLTAEDARAKDNWALRWASFNGHVEVVRLLFGVGLTADDARAVNNKALRWACRNGHEEVVRLLLGAGLTRADAEVALSGETTIYTRALLLEHVRVGGRRTKAARAVF